MLKDLFDTDQYFKKLFYTLLFINIFFFLNIYDYPWIGDDYSLIFKPKLYNLINNNFFIFDYNYLTIGLFHYTQFLSNFACKFYSLPSNYCVNSFFFVSNYFPNFTRT